MGKVLVLAVGPTLKGQLMDEIKKAEKKLLPGAGGPIDAVRKIEVHARLVALAAQVTFECMLKMNSVETAKVTRLGDPRALSAVVENGSVLLGDKNVWWQGAGDR